MSLENSNSLADIGLIGLAVMGENLVLNMESKGFKVAVFNRTVSRVEEFISGRGKNKNLIGCTSIETLAKSLKKPRKIMLMVRAGEPVDLNINQLLPFLESGDIIIDGGNSYFPDTNRRTKFLREKQILFIGTGVSGGEEGALKGPSIMPGGSHEAWPSIKPIFQAISAKVEDGSPCCDWVGEDGAGHFVKMVHNGIEYGDMQLISEAYEILKSILHYSNEEIYEVFKTWNTGDLESYLIEITRDIFTVKDEFNPGTYVIDNILDAAGQKGTGKWTVNSALDFGMPLTLIAEAVFARCLSSMKNERVEASKILPGPRTTTTSSTSSSTGSSTGSPNLTKEQKFEIVQQLEKALFASKLISYAQGFLMMSATAKEFGWNLQYGAIALMWRGGCIIRSAFLAKIKQAFDSNPNLTNLLLDPFFREKLEQSQDSWRKICGLAITHGVPMPSMTSALSYYDGIRSERLPANLIQVRSFLSSL
eukprot:TRINITY_DN213_c0_g1_i2.p1 TRINITY_DN213_c0_g1~~TRINITY_DN213_c0_g1_i2.p1  ORF type:complete len:478 (+),score=261.84 TRINITY_DN213_c0_g1_i2:102-1535(+)